jgi:hypothetical protein
MYFLEYLMAHAQQERVQIALASTAEKEVFMDKFEFLSYGLRKWVIGKDKWALMKWDSLDIGP